MGDDLEDVFGSEQLAGGLEGGIEGSIHAISALYNEMSEQGHGLLLLDAANAFNAVNRKAALLNSRKEWPRASTFLFNGYQRPAEISFRVHKSLCIAMRVLLRVTLFQCSSMAWLFFLLSEK